MDEFALVFTKDFEADLVRLELEAQRFITKKVQQLKERPLLGKRLAGCPYWALHIGAHRVIYKLDGRERTVELIAILDRKHDYRELGRL